MSTFLVILVAMLAIYSNAKNCPKKKEKFVDLIDKETFVENLNSFNIYSGNDAGVTIDKLTEAGRVAKGRYSFQAFADGDYAVVWDSVNQAVVNCRTVLKTVIIYKGCKYYCDQRAIKKCRQAKAFAEIDVYGEQVKIDVSKLTKTRGGKSTTIQQAKAVGKSSQTKIYQKNSVGNQRGETNSAGATITTTVSGDDTDSNTIVQTEATNKAGQSITGGGDTASSRTIQ